MYNIIKTPEASGEKEVLAFSVTNEHGIFCDISNEEKTAQSFADLLNKNDVSEEHVLDVIEDFFYG